MSSWGKYPYGSSPWAGTSAITVNLNEVVTISESLDVYVQLRLDGAVALTANLVQLTFNQPLDFGYAPILLPSNYGMAPSLTVLSASIGPTSNTVRLTTGTHLDPIYTVTVGDAKSNMGDLLDPAFKTAVFAGAIDAPTFRATAQSRTKIQLVFSEEMLQNAALSDALSYTVTDLALSSVSVTSATVYGPTPVQRVTLELGSDLDPGGHYVVTVVSPNVKTATNLNLNPDYSMFRWDETQTLFNINIDQFSGEVSGGLLGQPLGQVFFSPALEAAIANSSIQVDSVSCCTRAYDVYTFPSLPDPCPLMTFGSEQPYSSVIGTNVLWAPAHRLGLAQMNVSDVQTDTLPTAVDGPADATLQETFDQSRVSLLNVDDWVLFDGVGTPFSTADNLTPIPAGTTTNINLQL
jgi:hypothetical protein